MKIVVLIKQVPDTYSARKLHLDTGLLDRASSEPITDEINERALEAALQIRAKSGGDVTVVTMGPEKAAKSLRSCLAMGADSAVHICDDRVAGSDAIQTSAVLATVLSPMAADLIIAGNESTDGRSGALPSMIAERLGLPQLTFLNTLAVTATEVTGTRVTEEGLYDVRAPLPAVVSVTEQIAEPRYPGLKGIMGARKKPLTTVRVDELGLGDNLGSANSWSQIRSVSVRPARAAGHVITDDGTAGTQLVEFLAAAKVI